MINDHARVLTFIRAITPPPNWGWWLWFASLAVSAIVAGYKAYPENHGRCLDLGFETKMLNQNVPKTTILMPTRVPVCHRWEKP